MKKILFQLFLMIVFLSACAPTTNADPYPSPTVPATIQVLPTSTPIPVFDVKSVKYNCMDADGNILIGISVYKYESGEYSSGVAATCKKGQLRYSVNLRNGNNLEECYFNLEMAVPSKDERISAILNHYNTNTGKICFVKSWEYSDK
jgi:hypothetical protein